MKHHLWLSMLLLLCAVGVAAGDQQVEAVQPDTVDSEDQETLPEIPETIVPGRPGPFPAAPLESDTVISPTRTPTPSEEIGSSVSVITEQQIVGTRQDTVTEVLRGTVGLDAVRQGGQGGLTSVFLRGANSQHTKVLLDGIPINDPSNATRGFDFSSLMVDNIERIEVLRGPQSVLYGSDALGGVINIVTKRGEGPLSIRATGMGGALGTSRESVLISGGDCCRYFSLSGSYFDHHGISAANSARGNPEKDSYTNGTLAGRFGWTPSDDWNVDYVFRYADVHAQVDDFDFFRGLPQDDVTRLRTNLTRSFYNRIQLQSQALDGGIEQIVGFNLTNYDRGDTVPAFFAPEQFNGQSRQVDYQANLLLTETNIFTVGAGYLQEEASTSLNPLQSQDNAGFYLQDQFQLGQRWYGTAGVRWDDNSEAGSASTYRFTSVIRVDETGTAIHGSIGTGFRAPALAENLFAFGNPDLRPERSKGWDVGLEQELWDGRLVLDATYFRNDFRDLIVFDFSIPPLGALNNVGLARATGVEVTGIWYAWPGTSLTANYTLTDTVDLQTGQPLLRRPRHKAFLSIVHDFSDERATVRFSVLYTSDRLDIRDTILPQYVLANLSGSYDLTDQWQLFARIDNLLDEDFEEVLGYGTPGITGYAGLSFLY